MIGTSEKDQLPTLASALVLIAVYVALGIISLSTAYIQANTATVWIPSGFAVGLLIAKGRAYWTCVAAGSFLLNLIVNVESTQSAGNMPLQASAIAVAAIIAAGNTCEALAGAWLANRYANGTAFLFRPRSLSYFLLLAVPIPPLISAAVGFAASRAGNLPVHGSLIEVFLTWYVANAVGILVFAGLTVFAFTQTIKRPTIGQFTEILALALCLAFAIQAVCGLYISNGMADWPKAYMLIPLILWATFRFGGYGGLIAIALTTFGASIGTMHGFMVFPASSPSQSLIYLQVYLAMLALVTLTLTAALSEAQANRSDLQYRVDAKTRAVEQLLNQREVVTALIAHDLKSPVYGVRNTLRTLAQAVEGNRVTTDEIVATCKVMEETCTTLGDRIGTLLLEPLRAEPNDASTRADLVDILKHISKAHQLSMRDKNVVLAIYAPTHIDVLRPTEVEHIVDTLVDNAIRYSPVGGIISVTSEERDGEVFIRITDQGPGLPPEYTRTLFSDDARARDRAERPPALGLFLAHKQAEWLGGRLTYSQAAPHGAIFTLILPAIETEAAA